MVTALVRVPFRRPWSGPAGVRHNLAQSVTREVVRSFMGYSSGLPIDEFRSIEVRARRASARWCSALCASEGRRHRDRGGRRRARHLVPARRRRADRHDPVPARRRLRRHVADRCTRRSPAALAPRHAVRGVRGRLPPGARVPVPGGASSTPWRWPRRCCAERPSIRLALPRRRLGRRRAWPARPCCFAEQAGHLPGRPALILFSPEVDLMLDQPSVTENATHDILPWNIPAAPYLHGESATSSGVGDPGRRLGLASDLRRLGDRRDVPRRDPNPGRAPGEGPDPDRAIEEAGMFHVFPILMPWAGASRRVRAGRRRLRPANGDPMTENGIIPGCLDVDPFVRSDLTFGKAS